MNNKYLEIQYKIHIRSMELFLAAIREAAMKDDQTISPEEAKQLRVIEKKCSSLKKLLQKYLTDPVQSK